MAEQFDNGVRSAVRPPTYWLNFAAGAIVVALILSRLGFIWAEVAGYLVASFGAVGMLVMFRRNDMVASRSPYYAPIAKVDLWQKAIGVAVIVACAACAWPIATSLARG